MTAQQKTTRVSDRYRGAILLAGALVGLGLGVARAEPDDPPPAPRAPVASATPAAAASATSATTPAQGAPATTLASASGAHIAGASAAAGATATAAAPTAAAANGPFASQDRWEHAGYNQDEIVYTVFITNRDANILRCRTEIHGFYFNNGQKGEISDVQVSTVFPDKQVQAGIWSGLDEASGATYKVSCHAL